MGRTKTLVLILALALVLVGAGVAYNALSKDNLPDDSIATQQPQDDDTVAAPDFTVYDAGGNAVHLSDFLGQPVVLNFWASWCPPCKAEMPEFETVYQDLGGEVAFLMVDMVDGGSETQEKGQAHVDDQGYTFPVYFDLNQDAAYAYGVRSIPTTYFIDTQGNIAAGAEGQINEDTLRYGITLIQP